MSIRLAVGPALSAAVARNRRAPSGERGRASGPTGGRRRLVRSTDKEVPTRERESPYRISPRTERCHSPWVSGSCNIARRVRRLTTTGFPIDTTTAEHSMAEEITRTAPPASIAARRRLSSATATTQQTVTIPLEQVQAFTSMQARLAQLESEQRSREQATQQEQARILAQKGEVENALRMLREQSEQQVQAERSEAHAGRGSGQEVRPGWRAFPRLGRLQPGPRRRGATHPALAKSVPGRCARRLLRRPHSDVPVGRRFRAPAAREARIRPFRPGPEPGRWYRRCSAVGPGAAEPPAEPAQAPQPKNMGEAVILHMQSMQKAQGDPRANISLPMGLKAVR